MKKRPSQQRHVGRARFETGFLVFCVLVLLGCIGVFVWSDREKTRATVPIVATFAGIAAAFGIKEMVPQVLRARRLQRLEQTATGGATSERTVDLGPLRMLPSLDVEGAEAYLYARHLARKALGANAAFTLLVAAGAWVAVVGFALEPNEFGAVVALIVAVVATSLGVTWRWWPSPGSLLIAALACAALTLWYFVSWLDSHGLPPFGYIAWAGAAVGTSLYWSASRALTPAWRRKPSPGGSKALRAIRNDLRTIGRAETSADIVRFETSGVRWTARLYREAACFFAKGDLLGRAFLVARRDRIAVSKCDQELLNAGETRPIPATLRVVDTEFPCEIPPADLRRLLAWLRSEG